MVRRKSLNLPGAFHLQPAVSSGNGGGEGGGKGSMAFYNVSDRPPNVHIRAHPYCLHLFLLLLCSLVCLLLLFSSPLHAFLCKSLPKGLCEHRTTAMARFLGAGGCMCVESLGVFECL